MDEAVTQLEADYCPPLDSALLSAIVWDYDLTTEEGLGSARATLDLLKESALAEEAAGFDPSGTGGNESGQVQEIGQRAESCPETGTSRSRDTDATSLSNGLSALDLEDHARDIGKTEDLEALDEDTKIMLLREVFGDHVSRYSAQHTLRKCNGQWNRAMEELLNHVSFGETDDSEDGGRVASKGIEGFAEQNVHRGRKGKAKNRKFKSLNERRSSSHPVSPEDAKSPTFNRWQSATEDVDFIASRSGLETAIVKSTYYDQRASVPQTINALLKLTMDETKKIVTDDARVQSNAQALGRDFPSISPHYLAALIRLTHPSTADAHDLAEAMTAKPKDPLSGATGGGSIQLIPQYARPDAFELASPSRSARSATSSVSPPPTSSSSASYAAARAQAFSQASAAHRKAKSNHLMGGAAAYYSQRGRDLASASHAATASSMSALAASQSTSTSVDLHGVDVLNGIRIASERVERWWEGLGEARINGRVGVGERGGGYRVVVGRGTHSEGGKGKLGPAVGKALRGEGWRVENEGASLVVRGRARA